MRRQAIVIPASVIVSISGVLAACGSPSRPAEPAEQRPPAAESAAAPAPDPFPRACVDCHVNRPDLGMDVRLSTLMARWVEGADERLVEAARACAPEGVTITGRHPPSDGMLDDMPRTCLECHGRGSTTAPPFASLMHRVHYAGGASNHYVHEFAGRCEPCHKLDERTGAWSVPSGAER